MGIERDSGQWSFETDVVIVGGGGCGLTAAMAAAQGGAEVFVLEKQPRPWSNTARSGGMIPAAGTRFQKTAGIEETPEDFAEDIFRKNNHTSDPEMTLHLTRISPFFDRHRTIETRYTIRLYRRAQTPHGPPTGTNDPLACR